MNKHIQILLLLVALTTQVIAQRGGGERKEEKIEQIKIAMLSTKLNLDEKTAQRFWPIYNQFVAERNSIIEQKRAGRKEGEAMDASKKLEMEEQMLNLKKRYMAEFSKVLNPTQVNQLFEAEREFREMLMRRMKNKEEAMMHPHHGGGMDRKAPMMRQERERGGE